MHELDQFECERVVGGGPADAVVLAGAAVGGAGVMLKAQADRAGPLAPTVLLAAATLRQAGQQLMNAGYDLNRRAGEPAGEPTDPPTPYRPPVPELCGPMDDCDFTS
jgi:hypothetical protein